MTISRVLLALCLFLVSSYAVVIGREIQGTPYIDHWLRNLAAPDASACTGLGDKIADPEDCHNYYVCIDTTHVFPEVQTCAAEFDCFDPATATCLTDDPAKPDEAKCPALCASTSKCTYECPADGGGFAAKHDDCTKYTQCFADFELVKDCPADKPYFNGQECDTDITACCTCKPPSCGSGDTIIPDPNDCHAYYACLDVDGNGASPQGPIPCANGGSFVNGKCDSTTTDCTNPCPTGGDSTTPSSGATTPSSDSTTPSSDSTTPSSDSTTPSSDSTTPSSNSSTVISETTTTGTTTTDDGCTDLASFICPAKGFYAHCDSCDPSYIKCDRTASTPYLGYCTGELVFNPNPDYPYCLRPENCPFPQ